MAELSYAQVSALLKYDSETGKLFWKERPLDMFSESFPGGAHKNAKRWNERFANKEAFSLDGSGYVHVGIFGRLYRAHRICWLLHHGEWPTDQVDHINGNKSDNRIANLRDVSYAENQRNQKRREDNSSGVIGVCWHKRKKKWVATIQVGGRQKYIGHFDSVDLAADARAAASREFGYHENHGRE
jgi:hypothetical protein